MVSCTGGLVGKQIKECPTNGGEGGGGGIVIYDEAKTPCARTKALLQNTNMQASITQLKTNATSGTGEMGFKATKAGVPSAMIPGLAHSVNFGDKTGYAGGYHNHTKKGIPMHSPPDIDQLLGFARAQGNQGDTNVAFLGMISPNGMHYIIRFVGTYQDSITFNFMDEELKKKGKVFKELEANLKEPILNGSTYISSDGSINNKGVEKLFFETLRDMGLSKVVGLQRIETDGSVQNIYLDNITNQTIALPCP